MTAVLRLTATIPILFLTLFVSCSQQQNNLEDIKDYSNDAHTLVRDSLNGHYLDTTLLINNTSLRLKINNISEEEITLTFHRNNNVFKVDTFQSLGIAYFDFVDFNQDNFSDFIIAYVGNIPTHFIYLFDPITNEFKYVEGLTKFPEAKQLKTNKKYYYSYRRAGCSDMNWVSDLFYIDNFQTVHVGHLYGQGCDYNDKENPQTIEVYKVIDNDENKIIIVEKLPFLEHIPDFGYKWTFIEKYWNKNYKKYN